MARYFWRWLVLVFWASLSLAGAQGMRNPPEGNAALGQAGAFIAQCDDPSAITHNPAGLIQITGTEWLAGVNTILSNTWYRSDLFSDKKDFSPIMLPYVFLSSDLGKEKFRVGVGVTIPFGQSTEWSQETVRKWNYASPYYAGLQTADVITAGCWKLSPELSLGVALHVYSSRLAINNLLPFPVESEAKIRVTGYAAAPALGLLYRQSRYSFGLTYKAKFSIDYDGKLRWLNFGELPAEATINFPALAGAGFAFRPTPSWKIETDVEWIGYSVLDQINLVVAGLSQPQPRHWRDCYTFSLGTEYQHQDRWKLRGGLAYLQTPVPATTLEPTLADADRLAVSFGGQRKFSWATVEASVTSSFFKKRHGQSGAPYDGQYRSSAYFLNLSCQRFW